MTIGWRARRTDAARAARIEAGRDVPEAQRWNHNIHYGSIVLSNVPPGARTALDVGGGNGMLARRLRAVVPEVTAIDADADQIALALEESGGGPDIRYLTGDVFSSVCDGRFDVVSCVATLHHLGTEAGLHRLAELVAPGGTLVVIGLARTSGPIDLAHDAAGFVATRVLRRTGGRRPWEHTAPVAWPTDTYADVRRAAARILPGARVRRHILFRYSLVWTEPHV